MRINNVSNLIISSIKHGVVEQLSNIKKENFHGASIQTVEKKFFNTIGKSGAAGLAELFLQNDVKQKSIVYNGEKHYLKFRTTGKYLTLLGEIILNRGIYQSNTSSKSLCPLEDKLKFINDYVSFAAAEYICYSLASMTPHEFVKHCHKWSLMKPSASTITRVVNYVGNFLENSDFYNIIRLEETIPKEAVTLAVSMDATSVLIKKEGWRHATAATISTYNVNGDRLDTIYIGRMPEKNKIKIKKLLKKEVESIYL